MKTSILPLVWFLCVCLLLTGWSSPTFAADQGSIKKIALVSMAINNYKIWGGSPISDELVRKNIQVLATDIEGVLAEKYTLVPAAKFIGTAGYASGAIPAMEEGLVIPEKMHIFSKNRKELVKGVLSKEQAQTLCKLTGADAVITFYSEWLVATGKFIPTNKAQTKNCISMYDKEGKQVFFKRKDVNGEKVLGSAYSNTHINQDTLDQWMNASIAATRTIFAK